jgi:rhodanese-related sulfurtransferase
LKLPTLDWLPIGKAAEISPDELQRWLAEGRPVEIVDARTLLEYEQGTIGAARHAPLTGLPGSLERLDLDPRRPVVVLCLSGHRSRPGTRWLRRRGYEAYSLKNGILAWRRAGYPLRKPGGS